MFSPSTRNTYFLHIKRCRSYTDFIYLKHGFSTVTVVNTQKLAESVRELAKKRKQSKNKDTKKTSSNTTSGGSSSTTRKKELVEQETSIVEQQRKASREGNIAELRKLQGKREGVAKKRLEVRSELRKKTRSKNTNESKQPQTKQQKQTKTKNQSIAPNQSRIPNPDTPNTQTQQEQRRIQETLDVKRSSTPLTPVPDQPRNTFQLEPEQFAGTTETIRNELEPILRPTQTNQLSPAATGQTRIERAAQRSRLRGLELEQNIKRFGAALQTDVEGETVRDTAAESAKLFSGLATLPVSAAEQTLTTAGSTFTRFRRDPREETTRQFQAFREAIENPETLRAELGRPTQAVGVAGELLIGGAAATTLARRIPRGADVPRFRGRLQQAQLRSPPTKSKAATRSQATPTTPPPKPRQPSFFRLESSDSPQTRLGTSTQRSGVELVDENTGRVLPELTPQTTRSLEAQGTRTTRTNRFRRNRLGEITDQTTTTNTEPATITRNLRGTRTPTTRVDVPTRRNQQTLLTTEDTRRKIRILDTQTGRVREVPQSRAQDLLVEDRFSPIQRSTRGFGKRGELRSLQRNQNRFSVDMRRSDFRTVAKRRPDIDLQDTYKAPKRLTKTRGSSLFGTGLAALSVNTKFTPQLQTKAPTTEDTRSDSSLRFDEDTDTDTAQLTTTTQRTTQKTAQQTKTKTKQENNGLLPSKRLSTKQTPRTKTPTNRAPPNTPSLDLNTAQNTGVPKRADVYVKTRGEFKKANNGYLSFDAAKDVGAELVDNSSARTFQIRRSQDKEPSKQRVQGNYFEKFKSELRRSKTNSDPYTYVEKSRAAINTRGELKEITFKALQRNKKDKEIRL
jgi:hypothetical protein